MVLAADYPFLDIFFTMLLFFAWAAWLWMLIVLLSNVFGRDDLGGWAKAGWTVFMIVLPFAGVLTYLIFEYRHLGGVTSDERVRGTRQTGYNGGRVEAEGPASEIAQGKQLLDSGAITEAEFASIKAHALAH
jgi:hypothetical protein